MRWVEDDDEVSLMKKRVMIRRMWRRAIKEEEDDDLPKICEGPINQYQSTEIMINPTFIKLVFLGFSIATQGTYEASLTG